MNEMMVAIAISNTLLNMSFLAEIICTTHNSQPRGIVMSASMKELGCQRSFGPKRPNVGVLTR